MTRGDPIRCAMTGNKCQIWYVDIFNILKLQEGVRAGAPNTYYLKDKHPRASG